MLNIAIGAYGFAVSAFVILRLLLDETFVPVAIYNTFAHLLWLAALLLLPLCLLLRFWRVMLLILLPALSFILTYGGQFVRSADAYQDAGDFSIMTYNVRWRAGDYADAIALIRAADADIVAVQELGEAAAALLQAQLADTYPHMALHPHATGTVGQGILSRYPILDSTFWQSEFPSFRQQRALVDLEGTEVAVYNVHFNHPFMSADFFDARVRARQVDEVLQRIREEDARVVLLGDFNMVDLNEDYARIDDQLTDAYFDAGYGMGWTFSFFGRGYRLPPLARIDYIFVSSGLDPIEARVWDVAGGSDHRPVWARLSIYDPTAP